MPKTHCHDPHLHLTHYQQDLAEVWGRLLLALAKRAVSLLSLASLEVAGATAAAGTLLRLSWPPSRPRLQPGARQSMAAPFSVPRDSSNDH